MGNKVVNINERISQYWLGRDDCDARLLPRIGRLIATPVSGLGFHTATQRGLTSRCGEFCFLPGELITFFIGEIEFPPVFASANVTPYDMGATPHEPINVVRLLYSVCEENNGILSLPAAVAQLASAPLDFTVDPAAFARQPALVRLLAQLGRPLVVEKSAVDRLDATIARYIYSAYLDVAMTLWFSASPASDYTRSLDAD